jgi:hypothetical protein
VDTLRGLDCQYGQGYYFAKPLTPDDLGALLLRQSDEPDFSLVLQADAQPTLRS